MSILFKQISATWKTFLVFRDNSWFDMTYDEFKHIFREAWKYEEDFNLFIERS